MKYIDRTVISKYEPKTTDVMWVFPTENGETELRTFVNGKWKTVTDESDAYRKPQDGIPESDLSPAIKNTLDSADISAQIVNNKDHKPSQFSGLGRVNLEKNIQTIEGIEKNILTQDMFYKGMPGNRVPNTNTIFVIQYDYDLNEQEITIPEGCVLKFEGGSIDNGKIVGNSTIIDSSITRIFTEDITIDGTWCIETLYPEWFGAEGDGITDDSEALQQCIDVAIKLRGKVKINKLYKISDSILIQNGEGIEIYGEFVPHSTINLGSGIISDSSAFILDASNGVYIHNINFKQSSTQTPNIHSIVVQGKYCSYFRIERVAFFDYTGYGLYFGIGYSQNVIIKDILLDSCGGAIGGDGSTNEEALKGLVVTGASIDMIDMEIKVNQVSPQNPLLDLSGFREYTADQIILEGGKSNSATCCKISNSRWNYLNNVHIEYVDAQTKPILGLEIVDSLYGGNNFADVQLKNPPLPIKVSANNTTIYIDGLQQTDISANTNQIQILGQGSVVKLKNFSVVPTITNILNPSIIDKISYSSIKQVTKNEYPVDIKNDAVIYDWNASLGSLLRYKNPYFSFNFMFANDIGSEGIVETGDIGAVYRIITAENPDFYNNPRMIFTPTTLANTLLLDKKITLSMTYKMNTIPSDAANPSLRIINTEFVTAATAPTERSEFNTKTYNELATCVISTVFSKDGNLLKRFLSDSVAKTSSIKYNFDIVAVKICIGETGYISAPVAIASKEGIKYGTTLQRPKGSDIYVGFQFFDTSLTPARPIYASAISGDTVTWVDATGTEV